MEKKRKFLRCYLLLGLAAGFSSTMFGIGGGLIMVPGLTLLFGFGIKEAVGTSLAGIIPISAVGLATEALMYGENIFLGTALCITCGSLAGVQAGAAIVRRIKERHLRTLFALFLLAAAVKMSGILDLGWQGRGFSFREDGLFYPLAAVGAGLLAGTCAVLFGVGGGIVVVPMLTFFFEGFSEFHPARATSLAVILPTSLVGALLHRKMQNVRWSAVKSIMPMALAGAVSGVLVANVTEAGYLKKFFAVVLILCGVRLLGRGSARSTPP